MELVIILAIVIFVLIYRGAVNLDELYDDNKELLNVLKEKDYDFYVKAKYGAEVDVEKHFMKRFKETGIALIVALALVLFNFSFSGSSFNF